MNAKEKRITLKEAAEMSGYTPDYLGQLIRKGKLPGEQVYANVAWVTTENAVRDYIDNAKKGLQTKKTDSRHKINEKQVRVAYQWFMYVTLFFLSAFLIFLFFLFSVQLEKKLHERTMSNVVAQKSIIE